GDGNDLIRGGNGNDTLEGGEGNDFIEGGSGDDLISVAIGHHTINGGTGNDMLYLNWGDGQLIWNEDTNTLTNADGSASVIIENNSIEFIQYGQNPTPLNDFIASLEAA